MIVEYIRYKIAETDSAIFELAWTEASTHLDAAGDCLAYELARCTEDPSLYVLRIEWTSVDAHVKGFRRGPAFRDFFKSIQPYLKNVQEMQHYLPTAVRGRT